MRRIAVVGATGFVGTEVLAQCGSQGLSVSAPRVWTEARTVEALRASLTEHQQVVEDLAQQLAGVDVVVNACGKPDATAQLSDELFGANALAPLLIATAAAAAGCSRMIHVSSAVVQGPTPELDSAPASTWFSPYSHSKVAGESALLDLADRESIDVVIYRPPSVHASDRRITRALARIARSPLSSAAGDGTMPTPQALRENVASALCFLARSESAPPLVVHHPWEGITAGGLMELLGDGHTPLRVPRRLAELIDWAVRKTCSLVPALGPHGRRLTMLWFGQQQARSWLEDTAWVPPCGQETWRRIGRELAAAPPPADRRIVLGVTVPMSMNLMRGYPEHLVQQGWDVHFVSSGPPLDVTNGFTHHVIDMQRDPSPVRDALALLRWARLLRTVKPDVVAVGTPKAGLLGSIAARAVGVRVRVYKLRGLRLETARGWRRRVLTGMEKLSMAASTHVVAVSPSLKDAALRAGLCDESKLSVLGIGSSNGVDLSRFDDIAPRQPAGEANVGAPVIGFVGRLNRDKGVFELLEAATRMHQRGVRFRLEMVGRIEDPSVEQALATARRRGASVTHLGYMEDPASAYASFDVLCLPTYREGFPTVVLEAGAAYVPTVTTRATGAIDSVVHGVTGLMVDPGEVGQLEDALTLLVGNPAMRREMSLRARERVEKHFSQADIWAAEVALYDSGLKAAPSVGAGPTGPTASSSTDTTLNNSATGARQ